MNTASLTPELSRLLDSARSLPIELVREVGDFADFLGHKSAEESRRELTIASVR